MNLPPLKLPEVLAKPPFIDQIPVLAHPPIDHFAIALPIIILLIELINVFTKKRAISVISLFLMVVAVVAVAAAYYSGGVDGKEAYPLLSDAGQAELKFHKLLGTYLLIASAVVLLFKLLSMILSSAIMRAAYMLLLIAFVAGILQQGKDGGELVYEYGANVEAVKALDDEKFDLQEELDEVTEELEAKTKELEALSVKEAEVKEVLTPAVEQATETVQEVTQPAISSQN